MTDKVVSGELVLPVDRAVKLTLHSLDVIHSFWVPEFGQKSDAVPGIETTLVITPTKVGEYALVCTELCGLGHATMRGSRARRRARRLRRVPRGRGAGRRWRRWRRDGRAIFASAGCGGCHAFTPAGTDAQVGPSLDADRPPADAPLEEFVRESIVDPNAVLAGGYQPDVMPDTFDKTLSEEQLDALVQYLVDGQGRRPERRMTEIVDTQRT